MDLPKVKRSLREFEQSISTLQNYVKSIDKTAMVFKQVCLKELNQDVSADLSSVKIDTGNLHAVREKILSIASLYEQELIKKSEEEYLAKDRSWFLSNLRATAKQSMFDEEGLDYVKQRLGHFNDFRHIGLEIGCGRAYWYDYLAALSPLYQVDINWSLFPEIASKFQPLFFEKDRMRFVKTTGTNLPGVDQETVDFVFSWNTFNYFPISVIKEYLTSIFYTMKPGAYAFISYANGDREDAFEHILEGQWSYNNSDIMASVVQEAGFEVKALFETGRGGSWIEFTKPGSKIYTIEYPKPGEAYCKKVY